MAQGAAIFVLGVVAKGKCTRTNTSLTNFAEGGTQPASFPSEFDLIPLSQ